VSSAPTIQLPPGYEDAKPVQSQPAQQASQIQLPPGYEDAKPVQKPLWIDRDSSAAGNVGKGALKGAADLGSMVPGENIVEPLITHGDIKSALWNAADMFPGVQAIHQMIPMIGAYEHARSQGASVTDAMQAAGQYQKDHDAILQEAQKRMAEWKANPTRETTRALTDILGVVGAAYAGGGDLAAGEEAGGTGGTIASGGGAVGKVKNFVTGAVKGEKVAQAPAKAALETAARASAEDAGVAGGSGGGSIRTLLDEPISQVSKAEDNLYGTLNKAAETDMKSLYDRREELQDALDDPTQVANKVALQKELATNQKLIDTGEANVTNALGKNAPDLIQQAKAATQQRYAMEEGARKLCSNESVINGNQAHGAPETINIDSAIRQVENLDKPSKFAPRGTPTRLQQMFGEDGAKALKQSLYDAQRTGKTAMTRQQLAKTLGKWVGGATVGTAVGGEIAKTVWDASH